jgi:hypothetical protein
MTEQETIDRMLMEVLEEDCYINPEQEIEYPIPAISFGEKEYETKDGYKTYPLPIGTYGNFSFIQAPPKSKKTFFISLLSAVYLKNELQGFGGNLRGNRQDKNVIHFDTEQGNFHASMVFKRPLQMTGLKDDKYYTYALRQLGFKERVMFIEYILYDKLEGKDIGLVIIDGIADLCADVNNIEQASEVVQHLMRWSKELNCHIVTVIHSNFGTDKPTGHLGSFLKRKLKHKYN